MHVKCPDRSHGHYHMHPKILTNHSQLAKAAFQRNDWHKSHDSYQLKYYYGTNVTSNIYKQIFLIIYISQRLMM